MSECNFTIAFQGSAADTVARIQGQIEKQGGSFNVNGDAGNFNVKVMGSTIQGSYTIAGSDINVSIEQKPFFISCSQMESFLRSQIGG